MFSSRRPGLVAACLVTALGCAEGPLPATGTLSTERFDSAIMDDEYVLRIRLPPDYDPDQAVLYPLVVQLDPTFAGLEEYATTVGLISQRAAEGEWPEAIVVGIDYDDPSLRERDYLPELPVDPEFGGEGADRFHRVLAEEILPYLDTAFRVDPSRRTIVGHSNGGVFAWYAAFRHAPPEAPLFSAIVAADCGYEEHLFTYEGLHDERSDSLPLRIYASRAVYNGAIQKIVFEAMIDRVRGRDYAGIDLVTETLETDHAGAVAPSFEAGLAHALLGSQP